jgi:hypothetical protein
MWFAAAPVINCGRVQQETTLLGKQDHVLSLSSPLSTHVELTKVNQWMKRVYENMAGPKVQVNL